MKTIFFSWQSDIKPVRNKLQAALKIAVRQLGDELEEAERPELDSDTQGTFGSEEILSTIFEKINSASIFIADVTPITSTEKKLIPNPNVMVEIGYALKAMHANCRLYIFCTDSEIELDIEKMPFDIKGKKLFGFDVNDKPSVIADRLRPMLEGMLKNHKDTVNESDYPYIYVDGASFTKWSNGDSVSFNVRNSDDKEYQLDAIEVEGKSAEPFKGLKPNETTSGIVINGVTKIFETANPIIKMTVSRGNKVFRLEQKIIAPQGADGQYRFAKFVESSVPVLS